MQREFERKVANASAGGAPKHVTRFLTEDETDVLREDGFERVRAAGLVHVTNLSVCDWLVKSITTFAKDVSSYVPGHFDAFAKVYHPISNHDVEPVRTLRWQEVVPDQGERAVQRMWFDPFKDLVPDGFEPRRGTLPFEIIEPMLAALRPATTTPDECYFGVWEGFGGSVVPQSLQPRLQLPARGYHVFRGTIDEIRVDFNFCFPGQTSNKPWRRQSANIWWPADHAWCVLSEIDLHGTYVGGSKACIDALLASSELEATYV